MSGDIYDGLPDRLMDLWRREGAGAVVAFFGEVERLLREDGASPELLDGVRRLRAQAEQLHARERDLNGRQ